MLEIKDLHASINGKEILKGINLTVKPGEVHAIMGPNGSGKSTLSSVLVGNPAFEVTKGSITFYGKNLLELSPEDRSHEGIFLSFQYPVEIPGVSMVNFMRAAVNEQRKYKGLPALTASEFLKLMREKRAVVELDNKLANRSVNEGFSGGEKKRNEIFQMAMLEPRLSILDETDSGLDIDALRIVAEGVNKLKTPETSTIVITHYQRLLDYIKPDIVHVLYKGRIVKTAGPEREQLIENYKVSLANLGKCGVKTVCYNFMPVIDWIRTDLQHPWADGTSSLYFDRVRFAYFDLRILGREGAEKDYSAEELAKVAELDKTITEAEKDDLIDTIIVKTQGFVNGNIKEGDKNPVNIFKKLLALYKGIDRDMLRENMRYFLSAIMPVCEEYGVNMCVHPDDPPFQVLGLPRIVTNEADIAWFLNAVDNPHNGLTFCAGSLSAGEHNDTRELAKKFAKRTHFVHLRSTAAMPGGNFIESSHLTGRGHLIDLIRIFEKENPGLPMRVDHGRMMLGDEDKGYNPGYSFHGRMLALAQVEGMMAVVQDEINN